MLLPSLYLRPADPNLPFALQRVSCCCPWFLFKANDQTPLALQPVSGCYHWFQIDLTDQTPDSAGGELVLFLTAFSGLLTEPPL